MLFRCYHCRSSDAVTTVNAKTFQSLSSTDAMMPPYNPDVYLRSYFDPNSPIKGVIPAGFVEMHADTVVHLTFDKIKGLKGP